LALAGEANRDAEALSGFLKLLFEGGQGGVGVGGIKVGDEEATGASGDGFP
jgi:hypothetical protein